MPDAVRRGSGRARSVSTASARGVPIRTSSAFTSARLFGPQPHQLVVSRDSFDPAAPRARCGRARRAGRRPSRSRRSCRSSDRSSRAVRLPRSPGRRCSTAEASAPAARRPGRADIAQPRAATPRIPASFRPTRFESRSTTRGSPRRCAGEVASRSDCRRYPGPAQIRPILGAACAKIRPAQGRLELVAVRRCDRTGAQRRWASTRRDRLPARGLRGAGVAGGAARLRDDR